MYEHPSPDPWREKAALGNVARLTAFGVARNLDVGAAPQLSAWLMGTTPSWVSRICVSRLTPVRGAVWSGNLRFVRFRGRGAEN